MATTKLTSPDLFNLESLNTALQLPSGTTAERPGSPSTGEWRYNTTTNLIEFYDGGAWRDLQSEDIPPIPSENFNVVLYTGNGGTQSITGVGFQPDFVWLKNRSLGAYAPRIFDSSRGATNRLQTSTTAANATEATSLTSFDADGFSLGSDNYVNNNGSEFVAWCWKVKGGTTTSNADGSITSTVQANTSAGFSVVQYTADGTNNTTIGHGLGAAPDMIIIKKLTATGDWITYHQGVGTDNFLYLNRDDAQLTQAGIWSNINSTTFNLISGYNDYNQSGQDYVAYCFASKSEYSKINSYTGNGSASGPIVNTGFEPAFVMIKRLDAIDDWIVVDNKRNTTNSRYNYLMPNSNNAENGSASGTINPLVDFLTNGFQIAATWGAVNNNGSTYIYMAIAADASSAPTLANSFSIATYSGNNGTQSIAGLGFAPSLTWIKNRSSAASHSWTDIMRGNNQVLQSNETVSQASGQITLDSDGFTLGSSNVLRNEGGQTYVSWNWKAASLPTINTDGTDTSIVSANVAAGFSIAILPNKAGTQNLGHGLDGVPDLIIMKQYEGGTGNWATYNSLIGARNFTNLNTTAANTVATAGYEYDAVTATTITNLISGSTYSYIYYCFKSIPGFSKIGSYTGVSSGVTITTGFRPSFIMVKSTSNVENWAVLDTTRGNQKCLNPNLNNAESDSALNTFTVSDTGFSFPDQSIADAMLNENGYEYIYMAFKENPSTPVVPAGEMAFLLVAGGGGGGIAYGGGGGAGGLRTSFGSTSGGGASAETNITLANGIYNVTIGAGGAGISAAATGNSGSNSSISGNATFSTTGGGGGGSSISNTSAHPAGTGGSGGGGSVLGQQSPYTQAGAAGTANEGFGGGQGGFGSFNGTTGAGGGGGAGAAGDNGKTSGYRLGGNGGAGLAVNIVPGGVFAGGGGAGSEGSTNATPGIGGGGKGGYTAASSPTSGVVNTGGGGGGSGNTTSVTSGAGGSGVGILRMRTADYSGTTSGSPIVRVYGEETILVFTGSGSYTHS